MCAASSWLPLNVSEGLSMPMDSFSCVCSFSSCPTPSPPPSFVLLFFSSYIIKPRVLSPPPSPSPPFQIASAPHQHRRAGHGAAIKQRLRRGARPEEEAVPGGGHGRERAGPALCVHRWRRRSRGVFHREGKGRGGAA